jgi:FkbM family methyltransferase
LGRWLPAHRGDFVNLDVGSGRENPEVLLVETAAAALAESAGGFGFTAVVDVGGNQGKFTELLASAFRVTDGGAVTIHTYEVMTVYVHQLEALKTVLGTNLQVHHMAVTRQPGQTIDIKGAPEWKSANERSNGGGTNLFTGASLLERGGEGGGYGTVLERVKSTSLDTDFPAEQNFGFVKIDTEGNDAEVLEGAALLLQKQRIGVIFFENNKMQRAIGGSLAKTVRFLEQHRYRAYLFGRHQLVRLGPECGDAMDAVDATGDTGNVVAFPVDAPWEDMIVTRYADARSAAAEAARAAPRDVTRFERQTWGLARQTWGLAGLTIAVAVFAFVKFFRM